MTAARINFKDVTILSIGCYLPTTTKEKDTDYAAYLDLIGEVINSNTVTNQEVIITADFNIHNDSNLPKKKQSSQDRIQAYNNFLDEYNLRENKPDSNTFFSKANDAESCLDWALTTPGIKIKSVDPIMQTEFAHSSDHIPVQIELQIDYMEDKTHNKSKPSTNKNFNKTKKIDWQKDINTSMYEKLLDFFFTQLPEEIWNLDEKHKMKIISDQMNLAALLSKKTFRHSRAIEKKSREIVEAELKLTKLNLMISKIEKERENITDSQMKLLKDRRRCYRTILRQAQHNWISKKGMDDNKLLTDLISTNSVNKIYEELKKMNRTKAASGPDHIIVYGKKYEGHDVIKGFEKLCQTRSRNERAFKKDSHYEDLKDINDMLRIIYKHDDSRIEPISKEIFKKLLDDLPRQKAEDINNCGLEHIIHASDKVQDIVREALNNITMDWGEYSDVLFNTVIANMLYKGKNKKKSDPMSYRRISIGSIFQKVLDRYMAEETNSIAKKAQGTSQYGFSKDINFLQLTVLRENVQKIAEETGKLMICLASDISDAFSQTTREAQMYECYKAGETGKTWLYSNATYSETYTVLKDGIKRLGRLIQELKGSRQGGIKSAPDFKLYYLMLDRMIKTADLGYKIDEMDEKLYLQLVADDSMSWVSSPEELQAVVHLFEHYAEKYAMQFCFPKTLINCYGRKKDVEKIRNSKNIKIAGNPPNFPEEAVHLGLIQCQDTSRTELVNVRARIRKASSKLLTMFGHRFSSKMPIKMSLNKLIWNTYIKPTVLTGLNALTVSDEALKELKQFEETVLRRMFKVRNKASVTPLYEISGIEPIEAALHKQTFSLFYNFWLNPQTPSSKVNKIILQNPTKYKKTYWPNHVRNLSIKYNIPPPLQLLSEPIPNKEKWKKYVAEKVNSHHNSKIKERITEMKTTSFLIDNKIQKYNKTGKQFINTAETIDDIKAINIKCLFLTDEYPTRVHDVRLRGKREDNRNCRICLSKNRFETDSVTHALEFCSVTTKDDLTSLWENIMIASAGILRTCPTRISSYFARNPGAKATFILNPEHSILPDNISIGQHLTTPHFLNYLSRYCWLIHKHRTRALTEISLSKNGKHDGIPHGLGVQQARDTGRRGSSRTLGQSDQNSSKGNTNKLTNYFLPTSKSHQTYSQVLLDMDSVNEAILEWQEAGNPYNSKHPHQLLAVIINPGISTVQGTVMWPELPGRTVIGRTCVYRRVDRALAGKLPFNGALEILSENETLIKNIHITTVDNFSKGELKDLVNNAPIIINPNGDPTGLHQDSKDILSISIVSTMVHTYDQIRIRYLSTRDSSPQVFITLKPSLDPTDFCDFQDEWWVIRTPEINPAKFMENVMDWRAKVTGDELATILIVGRDGTNEETEKLTTEMRLIMDPRAHGQLSTYITTIPGRSLAYAFNSDIQRYNAARTTLHLNDKIYIWLVNELDRLRLTLEHPENFTTNSGIEQRLVDLTSLTHQIKDLVSIEQSKHLIPKFEDLRHRLNRQRQMKAMRNLSNCSNFSSGSSSSGVISNPSASTSPRSSSKGNSSRSPGQLGARSPRRRHSLGRASPPRRTPKVTPNTMGGARLDQPLSSRDIGFDIGQQIIRNRHYDGIAGLAAIPGHPDFIPEESSVKRAPTPPLLLPQYQPNMVIPDNLLPQPSPFLVALPLASNSKNIPDESQKKKTPQMTPWGSPEKRLTVGLGSPGLKTPSNQVTGATRSRFMAPSRFTTPTRMPTARLEGEDLEREIEDIRRTEAMYSMSTGFCTLGLKFAMRKQAAGLSPPHYPPATPASPDANPTTPNAIIPTTPTPPPPATSPPLRPKKSTPPSDDSFDSVEFEANKKAREEAEEAEALRRDEAKLDIRNWPIHVPDHINGGWKPIKREDLPEWRKQDEIRRKNEEEAAKKDDQDSSNDSVQFIEEKKAAEKPKQGERKEAKKQETSKGKGKGKNSKKPPPTVHDLSPEEEALLDDTVNLDDTVRLDTTQSSFDRALESLENILDDDFYGAIHDAATERDTSSPLERLGTPELPITIDADDTTTSDTLQIHLDDDEMFHPENTPRSPLEPKLGMFSEKRRDSAATQEQLLTRYLNTRVDSENLVSEEDCKVMRWFLKNRNPPEHIAQLLMRGLVRSVKGDISVFLAGETNNYTEGGARIFGTAQQDKSQKKVRLAFPFSPTLTILHLFFLNPGREPAQMRTTSEMSEGSNHLNSKTLTLFYTMIVILPSNSSTLHDEPSIIPTRDQEDDLIYPFYNSYFYNLPLSMTYSNKTRQLLRNSLFSLILLIFQLLTLTLLLTTFRFISAVIWIQALRHEISRTPEKQFVLRLNKKPFNQNLNNFSKPEKADTDEPLALLLHREDEDSCCLGRCPWQEELQENKNNSQISKIITRKYSSLYTPSLFILR